MNAQDAWSATLGQLQIQLSRATYNTWLRYARYVAYEDGRLVISVPHAYARDWLEQHLQPALSETFSKMLQRSAEVQIIVWDAAEQSTDVRDVFDVADETAPISGLADPSRTFENFAITEANRDTVLFCRFVLDSKFGEHPALFIAGNAGTGKTHLLQAMANVLSERRLRVVSASAEQFTSEMVAALRDQALLQAFRDKYRGCDVLILDEIEFFEGKERSQQELRYVWDTLSRRKRLMIFASRRLPRDLNIQRDLRSCFNRWLLCEIGAPQAESCAAILEAKAREFAIDLPAAVRDELVDLVGSDPAALEGALMQVSHYARLTHQPLSVALTQTLIKGRDCSVAHTVDVQQVVHATAQHYGVTVEELLGKRRTKAITLARHVAMFVARVLTDASLPQIGLALGGRDHTTVMHACNKMAEATKTDKLLAAEIAAIKQAITNPVAVFDTSELAAITRAPTVIGVPLFALENA